MKSRSKSTICVHSGRIPDGFSGINSPIFPSTAYGYLDTDERVYPRYFNTPNQVAVSEKLAELEHMEAGLVFSSGMAAISTTLLSLLSKGDHVIFQRSLYGGTINFFREDLERFGIDYSITGENTVEGFTASMRKETRLIYLETPSNPLLSVVDIEAVSNICKDKGIISVIDNTFASPINQNPADFGIEIVIHSATKYLGGHSDICAGAVLSNKQLLEIIHAGALRLGGSLDASTCSLLERSMKTLAVRVARQNENTMQIAEFLSQNKAVSKVFYPGLPAHPNHHIARKQMKGFGGMLSFELEKTDPAIFQERLQMIRPVMSLGGVETTITSPALTSHRHLSEEHRRKDGISDRLLRLSVGIEEAEDIINDLEQAL